MSAPASNNTVVTGLSHAQADGLACVVCRADYLTVRVAHVPVGRSVTGSQVFACIGECRARRGSAMNARTVAIAATSVVAAVAAIVSYDHMRALAERAGEGWKAVLVPLAVDGLVVAASTVLIARRRAGQSGGLLAWLALVGGVLVSLAANAAAAEPTLIGRAVAIIPPLALAVSFELVRTLISAGHQAAPGDSGEPGEAHQVSPVDLVDRAALLVAAGEREGRPVGRGRLARELEITEHQARQLLDQVTTKGVAGLHVVGEAG